MSSIQRLPKSFYRIYNKLISVDFDIPFLPKIKPPLKPEISIFRNEGIFNATFRDGYILNKDRAFYSKNPLIQTKHKQQGIIEYCLKNDLSSRDKAFKLLSHPMALSLFLDREYVIHSSAVEIDGKAFIFIGPSGSGKSYVVNSLLNFGKLITEDILCCATKSDSFCAVPSIPVIKLQSNELNITDARFKIEGDVRNRDGFITKKFDFENKPIKIHGCFILKEDERNMIAKCNKDDAFRNLFLNSFCALPKNKCIQSEKKLLSDISDFIMKTPIFIYARKKNHDMSALLKFLKL